MATYDQLDIDPKAREVYDAFLLGAPFAPIEGLFKRGQEYFIVCPTPNVKMVDGRTVQEWFDHELRLAAHMILLVKERPAGSEELKARTAAEIADGYGVRRTLDASLRDLALLLPTGFPLVGLRVEDREQYIAVERELEPDEHEALALVIAKIGDALPFHVEVTPRPTKERKRPEGIELTPARLLHSSTPRQLMRCVEEDEDFWRENYQAVMRAELPLEKILATQSPTGEACLVGTTFTPANIRSYLSLYPKVVLVMPLADRVDVALRGLAITRDELVSLASLGHVSFVAPQSVDRYDAGFVTSIIEAAPTSVTFSRRLAAAAQADQSSRNPLIVFAANAFDRRALLRVLLRVADKAEDQRFTEFLRALVRGLAEGWSYYEYALHVRGAMTSVGGPLAWAASAVLQSLVGKDFSIELGSAATFIEWASALNAHYAPYASEGYSEGGHCEFLLALHSGVVRNHLLASAAQFEVAEELLVIDADVDVHDFVRELGSGDLARFRDLVRNLARPGRSDEEVEDLVRMWNSQVRAYARRADRLKSMGLVGAALGLAKAVVGTPDLVSLSAVFIPMMMTGLQEEVVKESATLGAAVDAANARLASVSSTGGPVHRDAVLLARMKNFVKGMK